MDLYDTANINSLAAGGTMLVRRMDELIGHSKLLKPLRSKGPKEDQGRGFDDIPRQDNKRRRRGV